MVRSDPATESMKCLDLIPFLAFVSFRTIVRIYTDEWSNFVDSRVLLLYGRFALD